MNSRARPGVSVAVSVPPFNAAGYASTIASVRPVKSIGPASSLHSISRARHSPLSTLIASLIANPQMFPRVLDEGGLTARVEFQVLE